MNRQAVIVAVVALGAAAGCKRSSQNGTAGAASATATAATASSATTASTASAAKPSKPVASRVCHLGTAVTATEGRGANTFGIAASTVGVAVTWGELRSGTGFGPPDAKQRFEMGRVFDVDTLAAKAAAKEVDSQEAVDAFSNGIAPFALDDGTLGAASCGWAAFAGKLSCGFTQLAAPEGKKLSASGYDDPSVAGPGPEGDRVAAAGVGDAAVMLLPQCQEVRLVSSAGKAGVRPLAYGSADALVSCEPKQNVEVPALAAVSATEAAAVWRHGSKLEGRLLGKDGSPHAGIVAVSAPGGDVGAPAIASSGEGAAVVYAARTGAAPWALTLAHWKAGAPITRATVTTGADPAMAPALVPTDEPGCMLVSWTEGKGSATHVRAGLVCNDALVTASVVDVSASGVEAGDSELARAASSAAYVVWQELPKGKPAELRLAKITCD